MWLAVRVGLGGVILGVPMPHPLLANLILWISLAVAKNISRVSSSLCSAAVQGTFRMLSKYHALRLSRLLAASWRVRTFYVLYLKPARVNVISPVKPLELCACVIACRQKVFGSVAQYLQLG